MEGLLTMNTSLVQAMVAMSMLVTTQTSAFSMSDEILKRAGIYAGVATVTVGSAYWIIHNIRAMVKLNAIEHDFFDSNVNGHRMRTYQLTPDIMQNIISTASQHNSRPSQVTVNVNNARTHNGTMVYVPDNDINAQIRQYAINNSVLTPANIRTDAQHLHDLQTELSSLDSDIVVDAAYIWNSNAFKHLESQFKSWELSFDGLYDHIYSSIPFFSRIFNLYKARALYLYSSIERAKKWNNRICAYQA